MAGYYIVQQGDCLSSLAEENGLASWHVIYDAPENADFRQKRPNPNVILPGDQVFIPDPEVDTVAKETDASHQFVLNIDRTTLRIRIADSAGNPYTNCTYELRVGDVIAEGSVDDEGMIEETIDPTVDTGKLTVWLEDVPRRHCTWDLNIGHLDCVEWLTGVQARLNNMGYKSGPVDGIMGPITRAAVIAFQETFDLEPDGIPGPITQGKLEEVHGC